MEIFTVKDLSKLIKEKRLKLGMTQADASALCNVGIRFLSELENYENILSNTDDSVVISSISSLILEKYEELVNGNKN